MSNNYIQEITSKSYFETIKCKDEDIFNIHYHNKRISNTIGLNIDLSEYIYPPSNQLLKCKVIYNEEGIVDISYSKYTVNKYNIFKIVVDDTIEYKYKSTDRFHIEQLYLKKGIADDIIIVKDGFITDTSIANIAIFKDNQWLIPRKPLLEGTTRARLIQSDSIKESDISIEDLKGANKIAIMNAMIDFQIIQNPNIIY